MILYIFEPRNTAITTNLNLKIEKENTNVLRSTLSLIPQSENTAHGLTTSTTVTKLEALGPNFSTLMKSFLLKGKLNAKRRSVHKYKQ